MGILARLLVIALFIAGSAALWARRTHKAKQRIAEIDAGKRCLGCGELGCTVDGDVVRCAECGHVASLSRLRAEQISADDLREIMRPPPDGGPLS